MSRSNGSSKGLIIGTLIGGVAGSVTAMLLAPKSGKELREDIKGKAVGLIDSTKEYSNEVLDNLTMRLGEAKMQSDNLLIEAGNLLEMAKDETSSLYSGSKDTVLKEIEKLKSAIDTTVNTYKSLTAEEISNGSKSNGRKQGSSRKRNSSGGGSGNSGSSGSRG
jgi:gas vesicle protein